MGQWRIHPARFELHGPCCFQMPSAHKLLPGGQILHNPKAWRHHPASKLLSAAHASSFAWSWSTMQSVQQLWLVSCLPWYPEATRHKRLQMRNGFWEATCQPKVPCQMTLSLCCEDQPGACRPWTLGPWPGPSMKEADMSVLRVLLCLQPFAILWNNNQC